LWFLPLQCNTNKGCKGIEAVFYHTQMIKKTPFPDLIQ
jgi:hypothetical protein